MKKYKNKISEDEGALGKDATSGSKDTSSTTSKPPAATSSSTGVNPQGIMYVKTKDLTKPMMVRSIEAAKKNKVSIQVVETNMKNTKMKLEYISEVIDSETGEISKPFTINNKKYQMVRAINPNKEKVMGVYCMDEMDEDGTNKIYEISEFEETIAKKYIDEEGVVEPDAPEKSTLNPYPLAEEKPSFAGYKHFIVNEKTGKARKFKTIEELAKAQMLEGEKYMGIREFKKFVDETLFGASRKQNVNEVMPTDGESDEEMHAKAQKLMTMIGKRVPSNVIDTIKTNKVAQREVIAAFAELIGVPRNGLSQLVTGIRDIAKNAGQSKEPAPEPVKESRIIKIKDIK